MFNKGLLFGALFFVPLVLSAHHSVALNFSDEIVTFEGTVVSVKWINPHGSFVLEVTNQDGTS